MKKIMVVAAICLSAYARYHFDSGRSIVGGDVVEFYGDYTWNAKGGVAHRTHRDPGGRHVNGWIIHRGRKYD